MVPHGSSSRSPRLNPAKDLLNPGERYLNGCSRFAASSRLHSQPASCLNFEQVWSHVRPHSKTKTRVYLLQAGAAVAGRIKHHLKRSSVSHNSGKK